MKKTMFISSFRLFSTLTLFILLGVQTSGALQHKNLEIKPANFTDDDLELDQALTFMGRPPTVHYVSEAKLLELSDTQTDLDDDVIEANVNMRNTEARRRARRPDQVWDEVMLNLRTSLSSPKDAAQCAVDFASLATAAQGGSKAGLWAIQVLDAWGKPGNRLLKVGASDWGDYDGCLTLQLPTNFTTQYCHSDASIKQLGPVSLPKAVGVKLGLCIPSSCTGPEIQTLMNAFLKTQQDIEMTYGGVRCAPIDPPLTDTAKGVIAVLSIFSALIVLGTLYDVLVARGYWRELTCQPPPAPVTVVTRLDGASMGGSYTASTALPPARGQYTHMGGDTFSPGWMAKFLISFSVRSNGAKLLSTAPGANSISCINGVRFYSMAWVVLGHAYSMAGQGKTNQAEYQYISSQDWTFQAILNALVSVDSFFVLSGLLVTYLALKELSKLSSRAEYLGFLGKFYFHRYWRLTPPYMLVMMTYIPLFKYIGDGPVWPWSGLEYKDCEDTWWTNMLYINNVEKSRQMCMGWSWYLANDMQFFVISPFILIPLHLYKAKALVLPLGLILTNWIWTGVVSDQEGFGPNRGPDWFDKYYIKPWHRIGPYVIGMICGYVLHATHCKPRMRPLVAALGWAAALTCAALVLYGPYEDTTRGTTGEEMTTSVAALYNATHRTMWGVAVAWVVYACATGYGGPINTLLSWRWLLPLSRMTYCAYLVHPLVINYFFLIQRTPFYVTTNVMIFAFLAILWITFFLAFIASMAFESPFLGLEKLILAFFGYLGRSVCGVRPREEPSQKGGGRSSKPTKAARKEEPSVRYSSIANHHQ